MVLLVVLVVVPLTQSSQQQVPPLGEAYLLLHPVDLQLHSAELL
jgi:hypothetical protein